jgi:hypothetical protein
MIVVAGLVILIAAVIAAVAGVLGNTGSSQAPSHGFAVFGYHVTGSTGTLFLYGIVVGAIALSGLSLLLAAARRMSRRGREARRGLERSRRQTAAVSQDRDDLISQRDAARASTAGVLGNGPDRGDHRPRARGSRPGWLRLPGHRTVPRQAAAAARPHPLAGQPVPGVPGDAASPPPRIAALNGAAAKGAADPG